MTKKSLWRIVPLTLALVACEDSLTGIPDPVSETTPAVEAVTPVALASAPCVRPGIELVSWWTGDETPFVDFLGVNPIVSSAGVSLVDGVYDKAFGFGGSNTQIEIGDSPTLQPALFTVDLWAERTGPGANSDNTYGNMLVQKARNDMDLSGPLWSYFISWRADGHLAAGVYFDNDPVSVGSPVRIVSTSSFPNDAPIFIALTVDGTPDALVATLYVNGVVEGTFDAAGLGSVVYGLGGMGSTIIGANLKAARNVGFPRTFQGVIDEVEVFNTALTQAEILAIYVGGKCKTDNEAPVVDPVTGGPIDEADTFEASVSFTDNDSEAWTATVDYGDGTVETVSVSGTSVDLSHEYPQDGTYAVMVTVTDDAGAEGSATASLVVNNVAPSVDAGPDATIFEGDTFESVGSFTDPGDDIWTATVDYGDGGGPQPLALSGTDFSLSHTYAGNGSGPFTVTVTVFDDDGSGMDEAEVTVIYPLTIDQATVKLDKRRMRFRRRDKDTYAVDGRLPLSLLQRFDDADDVTVVLAGVEQVIPAASFVRKDDKWAFKAFRHTSGVQRIDLHDDGRFKIQARGPFAADLAEVDFRDPFDFSLMFGPDIGEASIQLDRKLHFRSHHRGRDDDDHRGHEDNRLKKFFRAFR